jgi:hypothetical protein
MQGIAHPGGKVPVPIKCPGCGKLLGKQDKLSGTVYLWCRQCREEKRIELEERPQNVSRH